GGGMRVVERLSRHDVEGAARWDRFVQTDPGATFFHGSAWQRLLQDIHGHDTHYLFAHDGTDVVGVLPLAFVRSWLFGRSLVSLPFAVYGGAVARDVETTKMLEARAEELARELNVDYLELRNQVICHDDWPRQNLYVTFRKALAEDDQSNLDAIPRK